MPTRLIKYLSILLGLILPLVSLSSCALFEGVGQDTGNGTPAVISTPIPTAPASARGATYAYIASNQLWAVLHGAAPRQITNFNDSTTPDVYWHTPAWSPGDHYLAVIVSAQPASEGGGGCPGPQFGANGALYVLDTNSLRLSKLTVPSDSADSQARSLQNGYWQMFFWQDATHLLAWYNGARSSNGATAGLYRYDLLARTLTQVLTPASLGVTTLFSQQATASRPILLGLRYSQGYLYYQEVLRPFTANSQLLIQRVSLARNAAAAHVVLAQGYEAWCTSSTSPYIEPGWDIASNGQHLVAQIVNQAQSSIETVDLTSGQSARTFAQLPATALSHDLTLAWNPAGQAIAAAESHAFSQDGPFCTILAQPGSLLSYTPGGAGQIAWRPDGQAFTLQDPDLVGAPPTGAPPGPYMYQVNQNGAQGPAIILLLAARNFAWG